MSCRLACKHDAVDDKRLRLGHPAKRDLEHTLAGYEGAARKLKQSFAKGVEYQREAT